MLEGFPLIGLTAPALLGIAILLLLFGRIVPRSTLLDKSNESEKWRQAYETEREARALSNKQTIELLELAKLTNAIVVSAFGREGVIRKQGEPDEIPTQET